MASQHTDQPGDRLPYQPALDGVRALSVIAVLAFHGGLSWVPGGFLGVDAFFVLSGYLITTLLLREAARHGRIRLTAFWGRRARRLLPASLLTVVAALLIGRAVLPPAEIALLRTDALATLAYIANWRMLDRGGDYFALTAAPSLLQHTWSLGIEEQFYLLWPLLLVGALWLGRERHRRRRRRSTVPLLVLCVAGAVASTAAMIVLARGGANVSRVYYGTDTRAASLLIGCTLAILLASGAAGRLVGRLGAGPRRAFTGLAGVAGVGVLLAWTQLSNDDRFLYRGGLQLIAVAVAVVIAHAVVLPEGPVARLLAVAPLPALGRISYGVYLWHWPIFLFLNAERTGLVGARLLLARCAVTLVVATVSYLAVERPIRHGRWAPPKLRPALALGGVAATALAVVAVTTVVPAASDAGNASPVGPTAVPLPTVSPTTGVLTRPGRPLGRAPLAAVFGDSVAWSVGKELPSQPGLRVTNRALRGCGVARGGLVRDAWTVHKGYKNCPNWDSIWRYWVRRDNPDIAVVLLGRWELMDRKLDGTWRHVGDPVFDAYLRKELELMMSILTAQGAYVVLLSYPYSRRYERPDGGLYVEDQPARIDTWNRLLREFAVDYSDDITMVDFSSRVCPQGRFTWSVNGIQLRSDGLHFTERGVREWIAPWLLPRLALAVRG